MVSGLLASHWSAMLYQRAGVALALAVIGGILLCLGFASWRQSMEQPVPTGHPPRSNARRLVALVSLVLLGAGVQQFLVVKDLHWRHLCVEHHYDNC